MITSDVLIKTRSDSTQARSDMGKLSKSVENVGRATEGMRSTFTAGLDSMAVGLAKFNLAMGGIQTALGGVKKALDMTREVNRMRDLERSLPTGAIARLSEATRGLYSEFDLVAMASKGMTSDLRLTAEQMGIVINAATALAHRTGQNADVINEKLVKALMKGGEGLDDFGIIFEKTGSRVEDMRQLLEKYQKVAAEVKLSPEQERLQRAGAAWEDFGNMLVGVGADITNFTVGAVQDWDRMEREFNASINRQTEALLNWMGLYTDYSNWATFIGDRDAGAPGGHRTPGGDSARLPPKIRYSAQESPVLKGPDGKDGPVQRTTKSLEKSADALDDIAAMLRWRPRINPGMDASEGAPSWAKPKMFDKTGMYDWADIAATTKRGKPKKFSETGMYDEDDVFAGSEEKIKTFSESTRALHNIWISSFSEMGDAVGDFYDRLLAGESLFAGASKKSVAIAVGAIGRQALVKSIYYSGEALAALALGPIGGASAAQFGAAAATMAGVATLAGVTAGALGGTGGGASPQAGATGGSAFTPSSSGGGGGSNITVIVNGTYAGDRQQLGDTIKRAVDAADRAGRGRSSSIVDIRG